MVTDEQVKRYRKLRRAGKSQELASAMAGVTAKTARNYEVGPLPSNRKKPRTWRTRKDPLEEHWEQVVVPLLQEDTGGKLQATTLLDELNDKCPGRYDERILRTLQRRVREWRALHGPDKEVFYPQEHVTGRECQIDFTYAKELGASVFG